MREYTERADKGGNNKRRIKQYVGKTKVEEKLGDAKDGESKFKKKQFVNVQFVIKAMNWTIAAHSRIKQDL